jgi:hypothetical protein
VIFAGIDTRGRPGSLLKIKGVFRDIFVRFGGADSGNRGFGPGL